MEVILLENIQKLGRIGDSVRVKPGFGRNWLIPQGKALPNTDRNVAYVKERYAELLARHQDSTAATEERARQLQALEISIARKATSEGKLFGSVSARDIADAVTAAGVTLSRNEVQLTAGSLQTVGTHVIEVKLGTEICESITIKVIPE